MNEVMLVGSLRQGPKLAPTANGFSVLWFSLSVNDRKIGKPEVMEVMCLPRWEPLLQQAVMTRQRIMVYGAIHTCEGMDPDAPGKHRFVRAGDVVLMDNGSGPGDRAGRRPIWPAQPKR